MQSSPQDNPNSNENTQRIFQSAKGQIESFFNEKENKPTIYARSKKELNNRINEFYKVQREFHESMLKFTEVLTLDSPTTSNKKVNLEELIKPYKILSANPFSPNPTGNDEDDLQHILNVISTQNDNFLILLRALALSISKTNFTQEILNELKDNPENSQLIKEKFGCNSWMLVEGQMLKPMQNLTRIELLLKDIKKTLTQHSENISNLLLQLEKALESLSPQIKTINENMDDLVLLNRIEQLLQTLSEVAKIENESVMLDSEVEGGEDHSLQLKEMILFTIETTRQGLRNVLSDNQDIVALYKNLLNFLEAIALKCSKINLTFSNQKGLFSTCISYFFSSSTEKKKTPLDELQEVITQLTLSLQRIEIVANIPLINEKARQNFLNN